MRELVLLLAACGFALPVAWMLAGSLNPSGSLFGPAFDWLPNPPDWRNYSDVWQEGGLSTALMNSLFVTSAQVMMNIAFSALAGLGFAKYRFRGREVLFLVVLSMTFLPLQMIMIPLFLITRELGWINTYEGLIIPTGVSAFSVFIMRQFIGKIPDDYFDAARLDGAGVFRILWSIVLPLSKPALVTVAVLSTMTSWDEFLWPLIVASDADHSTLPLAVASLRSLYQAPANWLLAASVIMVLPPLVAYLLAQRHVIEGIGSAGLKG